MTQVNCIVPMLNGEALTNAVGSNVTEATVNLDMVNLTDSQLQGVTFHTATLTIGEELE